MKSQFSRKLILALSLIYTACGSQPPEKPDLNSDKDDEIQLQLKIENHEDQSEPFTHIPLSMLGRPTPFNVDQQKYCWVKLNRIISGPNAFQTTYDQAYLLSNYRQFIVDLGDAIARLPFKNADVYATNCPKVNLDSGNFERIVLKKAQKSAKHPWMLEVMTRYTKEKP